jgi:outer membrane protein assembly factor BamA
MRLYLFVTLAAMPVAVWAQDGSLPATRAGKIDQERREKASRLAAPEPNKTERIFETTEHIVDLLFGSQSGLRPVIGGLATGAGFAAGPEYYRPDLLNSNMVFRTSARGSTGLGELLDAQVTFPHLAADHVFFDLYGVYQNYPSLDYYGPGPNSSKTGRADYRLETTSFDSTIGVIPFSHVRVGLTGGYLLVNVGPGSDDRLASAPDIYPPTLAFGINHQSNFLRAGPFVQFDYRDNPLDPHSGGNYFVSYVYYDDRKLDVSNHRKLTAEATQYFPFFNKKRVIALRGKTELSYRNTGQIIPFYLQPVLGGSDDLRGFRPFRFYDNNLMVMNAEYRWEVMTGFDMAVFADAGKVFHRHAEMDFTNLQTDGGFGLRFKTRSTVFMRWDVGFSREGFQVWIKFNNVF